MNNDLLNKIKCFENQIYDNLKKEKKRIIATTTIFNLPLSPKEIFEILYVLLNENSKNAIGDLSLPGQMFVRKFNQQSLHYVLTQNVVCSELELATFIEDNLFKLNFEILAYKFGVSTVAYTESWRYPQTLSWKTHRQLLHKQKKLAKIKGLDLKQSFYQQARL